MAVSRMRNEKYAIWPLVMAESPKLLHSSAMDLRTRLWGRHHVLHNAFLVAQKFCSHFKKSHTANNVHRAKELKEEYYVMRDKYCGFADNDI